MITPSARRCILLLLAVCAAPAWSGTREQQREQFQQAMQALAADDMAAFYRLESGLRNYALHDHLRFALAERSVRNADLAQARRKAVATEEEFQGRFLAWRIIARYRQRLRQQEQWQQLLDSAELPSANQMHCETLRAKDELGLLEPADPAVVSLWEKSRWSADCEWVMQRQLDSGKVSAKHLWQRLGALMDAGKVAQAKTFKRFFNSRDQGIIQAWIDDREQPELALQHPRWHANTALNRRVFSLLMARLMRSDVRAARRLWGEAHRQKRYDLDTLNAVARKLSLRGAADFVPEALDWLKWLPETQQDETTREARARLAVRLADWMTLLSAIQALTPEQRESADWRYWQAVADAQLGRPDAAKKAWRELAKQRSYYGFLAADRLGLSYTMSDQPTPDVPELRQQLQARADVQRMREYLFVGLRREARAEWDQLLKHLSVQQRAELSLLVLDWGWYDRAIATNGRSGHNDDLRVRFPLAYREQMQARAAEHQLSLPWVYAVARRESLFQPDVRSGAGAVGLMQLMPATAKDVARRMGKKVYDGALQDPGFNMALGSFYLRWLSERFDGHAVMATAAYNAGLSRVPRWLEAQPMAADRWVESIPYRETRDYTKAVMAYATVYDWRLNGEVTVPLSERMPLMPAKP